MGLQFSADQLPMHLAQATKSGSFKPVYVVCTDEPLIQVESADQIRKHARLAGCTDRQVFIVEKGFDAEAFLNVFAAQSLFGDKTLVEARIPSGKPVKEAIAALEKAAQWLAQGQSDAVLLVLLPRLNKTAMQASWFVALANAGVLVQGAAPEYSLLAGWIKQRLAGAGLEIKADALHWLANHVEGNLLAAAQEIEKLKLLADGQVIDIALLQACVANVARYNVFELGPACLSGDAQRVARMIRGLEAEGEAPTLILWVLQEDIRALGIVLQQTAQGTPLATAMRDARLWGDKQQAMGKAVKRHNLRSAAKLHAQALVADKTIKGLIRADVWQTLLMLALGLAGIPLIEPLENAL